MIIDIPIPEDDVCTPVSEERFNAAPKYLRCIKSVFWFQKDEKFILVDPIGYEPFPDSNDGTSLAFEELDALKEPLYFEPYTPNKEDMFDDGYDDDIWLIDTECAGVTWYRDAHFEGGDYEQHIVTFENISPECIKLIYKGTGESIW